MTEQPGEPGQTQTSAPLARSVFDTRGVAPRKAFDAWREELDHIADARPMGDPEAFHARAEAVVLDRLVLSHFHAAAFSYERSRFRVARDNVDHYILQVYRSGRMICRRTGVGEAVQPGDLMLADLVNAERVAIMDLELIHMVAPRALLAPLLAEPDAPGLRHIRGDNALVRLLCDHVNALYAQTPRISGRQAEALVNPLLQMTAAAINGEVRDETRSGVSEVLTQAIRRHVEAHALSPELTPEAIAGRYGISRRKLSYLFEADGGIATYVQNERLRRARLALMDPAQRGRTIAEIAEDHRFAHRTSFIRAFQRVYGLTPSQQRALSAGQAGAGDAPPLSPIKWIGRF